MIALFARGRWGVALMLGLLCGGCFPVAESDSDEKKDPHYMKGRELVNRLDFQGAGEAFEKALEANPRSASAHLELGILNMERFANYAAAIYHFEKFLKLDPNSPQGQNIRPRIITCKEELAKTVLLGPVTQPLQKEMERLTADNIRLGQQVEMLQTQLAQCAAAMTNAAGARFAPLPGTAPNKGGAAKKVAQSDQRRAPELLAGSLPGGASTNPPRPAVAVRKHTVKSGETPAAIARKYGVSLNALLKANPGLDPRRMKIGQTVNLPPQ